MSDVRCGRLSSIAAEACVPLTDYWTVKRERDRYWQALTDIAGYEGWQTPGVAAAKAIGGIAREALAPSEAEQAAAEAAGPEPGLAPPSVAGEPLRESARVAPHYGNRADEAAGYPGLLEDGPPNPENPELDGDE